MKPDMRPVAVRRLEAADQRESAEQRRQRCIRFVMGDRLGREFVAELFRACGLYEPTAHTNSLVMAANEGRRSVAVRLREQFDAVCPEFLDALTREARETRRPATGETQR